MANKWLTDYCEQRFGTVDYHHQSSIEDRFVRKITHSTTLINYGPLITRTRRLLLLDCWPTPLKITIPMIIAAPRLSHGQLISGLWRIITESRHSAADGLGHATGMGMSWVCVPTLQLKCFMMK